MVSASLYKFIPEKDHSREAKSFCVLPGKNSCMLSKSTTQIVLAVAPPSLAPSLSPLFLASQDICHDMTPLATKTGVVTCMTVLTLSKAVRSGAVTVPENSPAAPISHRVSPTAPLPPPAPPISSARLRLNRKNTQTISRVWSGEICVDIDIRRRDEGRQDKTTVVIVS